MVKSQTIYTKANVDISIYPFFHNFSRKHFFEMYFLLSPSINTLFSKFIAICSQSQYYFIIFLWNNVQWSIYFNQFSWIILQPAFLLKKHSTELIFREIWEIFYFKLVKKHCFYINILFLVPKKAVRVPHEKSYTGAFTVNIS